jgi:hypothetical protein
MNQLPQGEPDASHFTMESTTGEQEIIPIKPQKPRRIKALATNKDTLLSLLLTPAKEGCTRFNLPVCDTSQLPADAAIDDVDYDPTRGCFLIILSSEEFPECTGPVPVLDLPVDVWSVARVADDEVVVKRLTAETGLQALIAIKPVSEGTRTIVDRRHLKQLAEASKWLLFGSGADISTTLRKDTLLALKVVEIQCLLADSQTS